MCSPATVTLLQTLCVCVNALNPAKANLRLGLASIAKGPNRSSTSLVEACPRCACYSCDGQKR
ncbi:hypothetical protein PF005_g22911 [Phytophthora fragariae]|uniref:Uncharacterized protein n=1 Tax=Phytophthora fragariae TaxID=53985 RepID=A0A6A3RSG8_9STRA|nr:hypothetical protein PF003_g15338 [Phytophthora fragariae]KAE8945986.1 hypothetical protein PF009_g4355 [Phytophthora fragariae]KAE8953837.1 hypothetical protein PF011_g32295 [Phytophthora fragariae]KAE9080260.1 hypothetical protein PF010_g22442 [Phytophthora fragariae]KAE9103127.1 hypothetical protein PF006_g22262 [Phytophthora fragariae]